MDSKNKKNSNGLARILSPLLGKFHDYRSIPDFKMSASEWEQMAAAYGFSSTGELRRFVQEGLIDSGFEVNSFEQTSTRARFKLFSREHIADYNHLEFFLISELAFLTPSGAQVIDRFLSQLSVSLGTYRFSTLILAKNSLLKEFLGICGFVMEARLIDNFPLSQGRWDTELLLGRIDTFQLDLTLERR